MSGPLEPRVPDEDLWESLRRGMKSLAAADCLPDLDPRDPRGRIGQLLDRGVRTNLSQVG